MAEKSHGSSRAKSVLGGHSKSKSSKSGKHPHHIEIHRGKSGGFIVKHHSQADDGENPEEPDQHVVPDLASLQSHVADNMGDQPPMPAPAPAPAPVGSAPAGPVAGAPPPGM